MRVFLQVSASQLYGADEATRRELRSFENGKLKTEFLNNEHYAPYLTSTKRASTFYTLKRRVLDTLRVSVIVVLFSDSSYSNLKRF